MSKLGKRLIESANQALTMARGWQTIDTAPKDGPDILLATGYGVIQGAWTTEPDDPPGWITCTGEDVDPTHWMPLPDPPAA